MKRDITFEVAMNEYCKLTGVQPEISLSIQLELTKKLEKAYKDSIDSDKRLLELFNESTTLLQRRDNEIGKLKKQLLAALEALSDKERECRLLRENDLLGNF